MCAGRAASADISWTSLGFYRPLCEAYAAVGASLPPRQSANAVGWRPGVTTASQMAATAEEYLRRAREFVESAEDEQAAKMVDLSLQKTPAAHNPQAAVLKEWLSRFGKGSAADTAVQRVLACPPNDFYAVLAAPRFQEPSRAEYLKLSLLLHPDKCGARNTSAAFQRITEAYNMLKDPAQRAKYDDKLRRAGAGAAAAAAAAAAATAAKL